MPSLARVLESAEERVERLLLLTLVAAPDAAGVTQALDAAGFDSHARVVARTVACLPEIRASRAGGASAATAGSSCSRRWKTRRPTSSAGSSRR